MTAPLPDFRQDYFTLFDLPVSFRLDELALEQRYRDLQGQVHPDRFAHLPESERRLAMQWSTQVNEAWQTLRNPLRRVRYLLSLQGVDTQEETNTAMPMDFLMQQMEWREAIAEARQASDLAALDALEGRLAHEGRTLRDSLAVLLDEERDYAAAAGVVRKLKFMEKLAEDLSSAFDAMDN